MMVGVFLSCVLHSVADPSSVQRLEPSVAADSRGLSEASVRELLELIRETPPKDLRAVVVVKEGRLV